MKIQVKRLLIEHNAKNLKDLSKKLNISYNRMKNLSCGRTKFSSRRKYNYVEIPHKFNEKIAEVVGIVLGDGNIDMKQVRIFGHKEELEYYLYLQYLFQDIFKMDSKIKPHIKNTNGIKLVVNSVKLCRYLNSIGLKFGSKIKNKSVVPEWIFENKNYIKFCLKGLFDTDGSFFISSNNSEFNILWKMSPKSKLPQEIRKMLLLLKYNPTRIFDNGRKVSLCRKKEVINFFNEIKPRNNVQLKRYENCLKSIN
ncbi:MAG: hypothetical protein ACE5J4_03070 [Candidatus Aenigmatarchaeota archaeon]